MAAALASSRPSLRIAGQDQPDLVAQLLQLDVRDDAQGLARCEAEFGNWGVVDGHSGFRYFDRALLDFGKGFEVRLGDSLLFDGRVMGLRASFPEGAPPRITVLADDRLQDLRMTRRSRSFADMSDADVARRIAQDHGLQAEVDLPGPAHRHLAQVNQSDLAFLHERARANDAELWLEGLTLHLQQRAQRNAGTLTLTHGHQLRSFDVLADLAAQRSKVTVCGWDVAAKQAIAEDATDSVLGNELGNDQSGQAILQAQFGARNETLAHGMPVTSDEARTLAEAYQRASARRFVTGLGVAETSAGLRVGSRASLQGLGPLFSGQYTVTALRHRFDSVLGLRTEFHVERAGLGRP